MSSADEDRDCRAAVRDAVLDEEAFVRLTATGRIRGERPLWVRIVVRPVLVRGRRRVQFSYFDAKKDITKNYFGELLLEKLDELLAMPFRQLHVQSTTTDLYLRVTKEGKAIVTRGKPSLEGRQREEGRAVELQWPIGTRQQLLRTDQVSQGVDGFGLASTELADEVQGALGELDRVLLGLQGVLR